VPCTKVVRTTQGYLGELIRLGFSSFLWSYTAVRQHLLILGRLRNWLFGWFPKQTCSDGKVSCYMAVYIVY